MIRDFYWSAEARAVFSERGRFDPWALSWIEAVMPEDAVLHDARIALKLLGETGRARRVPVGVIGPKDATTEQLAVAESLGAELSRHGLQLLCGGKNGVMEAACKGSLEAGGLPIGLLPDDEWHVANPYVAVPIATGIGPARNAIIARGSRALVAVGGGYGTLSEMAFGLHFGRPVFSIAGAPFVEGAIACTSVEDVMERLSLHVLQGGGDVR